MPMTDESRRALFQQAITSYRTRGYQVVAQERWSATLSKQKNFNRRALALLTRILHLPGHATRGAHIVTIAIAPDGRIHMAEGRVNIPGIDGTNTPVAPDARPIQPLARIASDDARLTGRYEILCTMHEGGSISHVGFRDGSGMLHRLSKREAIEGIVTGRLEFYVARNGIPVDVIVAGPPGREFLKTEADSTSGNNLSSLPDCGPGAPATLPFIAPGRPLHMPSSPAESAMGAVHPYHALLDAEEAHKVYHDRDDCPDGNQIKGEDRLEGTGGRDRCRECEKLEGAGPRAS